MLIFIVGFMGSGKTTMGLKIAEALDIDFWDMDELIQDQEARSIREIFEDSGQDYFRELESSFLENLTHTLEGDAVLSTGGGAPCFHNNMDKMNKLGTTIYLEMDTPGLMDRLQSESASRPLIAGKDLKEMEAFINELLELRSIYYLQSTYIVDARRSPDEILRHILYLLNE